jgi:hypothetical protein
MLAIDFLTELKSIKAMFTEFNSINAFFTKACPIPYQAWYKCQRFRTQNGKSVTQWHPTHADQITSKCITFQILSHPTSRKTQPPTQLQATRRLPKISNHFLPPVGVRSERNHNAHCSVEDKYHFPSGSHNCISD